MSAPTIEAFADRGTIDGPSLLARVYLYALKGEAPSRGLLADIEAFFQAEPSRPLALEEYRVVTYAKLADKEPESRNDFDSLREAIKNADVIRESEAKSLKRSPGYEPIERVDVEMRCVGPWVPAPREGGAQERHGMVPGSHERPNGPECRCGAAWSRWDDCCVTTAAAPAPRGEDDGD